MLLMLCWKLFQIRLIVNYFNYNSDSVTLSLKIIWHLNCHDDSVNLSVIFVHKILMKLKHSDHHAWLEHLSNVTHIPAIYTSVFSVTSPGLAWAVDGEASWEGPRADCLLWYQIVWTLKKSRTNFPPISSSRQFLRANFCKTARLKINSGAHPSLQ